MNKVKTVFCDIDGTLLLHHGDLHRQMICDPVLLEGTKEKLVEWDRKGYNIILTTGRRESCRKTTEEQLDQVGIFYDQLIMGLGGGHRVLINDLKPNSDNPTAASVTVKRNEGIKDVEI